MVILKSGALKSVTITTVKFFSTDMPPRCLECMSWLHDRGCQRVEGGKKSKRKKIRQGSLVMRWRPLRPWKLGLGFSRQPGGWASMDVGGQMTSLPEPPPFFCLGNRECHWLMLYMILPNCLSNLVQIRRIRWYTAYLIFWPGRIREMLVR